MEKSIFEDMKTAIYQYSNWGDEENPASDWCLLNAHASFSHREACEFILYVGCSDSLDALIDLKYSDLLINLAHLAYAEGYKYLCLYS